MKMPKKSVYTGIVISILFLAMPVFSCKKPDSKLNQLLVYNATASTLTIESNYGTRNAVSPGKYCKMKVEESYSLHHLLNGFNTVSVYKNGKCAAEWKSEYVFSRPDSDCHDFFNLQSWEERDGGRKNQYVRFVFSIRQEDLNETD